jgi:hypothetical protein
LYWHKKNELAEEMIKKQNIAIIFFLVALCYVISPWFFEKKLFFNELLSFSGLGMLAFHRFKVERSELMLFLFLLVGLGTVHLFVSLWRMDGFYLYLRNSVIVYSMFSFFLGYLTFKYLPVFIIQIRRLLTLYIGFFLLAPLSKFFFERFGMSILFPVTIYNRSLRYGLLFLMLLCLIYSVIYSSATILILFLFYSALLIIPGYKAAKQLGFFILIFFISFFISIQSNLSLMDYYYSVYNSDGIDAVMQSNWILGIDPSTTWRLIFWKQAIVDQFPNNILGLGFGTPLFKFFPVYEIEKLPILPYVMGAHNSFVYLFARMGIAFVFIILGIYRIIFKEYFYFKTFYYNNQSILIFWSFFAVTIIAIFNPVLESPIYSSAYWLLLGFLAKAIFLRKQTQTVN